MAPATRLPPLPTIPAQPRRAGTSRSRPGTTPELRVLKKFEPNARGAKGLTLQYGDQLICVRHRIDETGTKRLTTVELVVNVQRINRRPGPTVDIALHPRERALHAKLKGAGAKWHDEEQVWSLRRSTAIALGLKAKIVPRRP